MTPEASREPGVPTSSPRYVYGIVRESDRVEVRLPGVGGSEVYLIPSSGLAAVVSASDCAEKEPTRRNMQAHLMVQNEVMRICSILPLAFGMIAENDGAVRRMLEKNHGLLMSQLARLAGKVEAGLRVLWNKEAMLAELDKEDREFSQIHSDLGHIPPGESAPLLMRLGMRVRERSLRWKRKYGEEIHSVLRPMAADDILRESSVPQCILDASYLIAKTEEAGFAATVTALNAQYEGMLDFRYAPRLPPYSFVELRIEGS